MSRFKTIALILAAVTVSGISVFVPLPARAQSSLSGSTSSPYFWNCSIPRSTLTPTLITPPVETLTPTKVPTQIPTQIPTLTSIPTPTSTVAETCNIGSATIKKGEGVCDEKTNVVTVCEGNNQMVHKPNFCGAGQVCQTQPGSYQIKCDAACQLKRGTGVRSKADLVV